MSSKERHHLFRNAGRQILHTSRIEPPYSWFPNLYKSSWMERERERENRICKGTIGEKILMPPSYTSAHALKKTPPQPFLRDTWIYIKYREGRDEHKKLLLLTNQQTKDELSLSVSNLHCLSSHFVQPYFPVIVLHSPHTHVAIIKTASVSNLHNYLSRFTSAANFPIFCLHASNTCGNGTQVYWQDRYAKLRLLDCSSSCCEIIVIKPSLSSLTSSYALLVVPGSAV
jgi:hypothetical protein